MEPSTKRYLLFIYLGLCFTNAIITAGYLQQKSACSGPECFKTFGISFLSEIFFFGLSFAGVLLAREKTALAGFAGIIFTGIVYSFSYAGIAFYSPYLPAPKLPLLLNFVVSLAAFVYTLSYGIARPGRLYGPWLLPVFGGLVGGSGYITLKHMADGGCDGGTCGIVIFFLPVYAVIYLLIFLALFQQSQKTTPWLRGLIFATIAFLAGLMMNTLFTEAQRDLNDDWSDPMFLLPSLSGAVFLTFLLKATHIFAPNKEDREADEAALSENGI